MKRVYLILIAFLLAMMGGSLKAQSVWSAHIAMFGGGGTPQNPYIISMPEHLAYLAVAINNGITAYATRNYRLDADIDLGMYQWDVPIGIASLPFQGTFEGNEENQYRIMNMRGKGLFGYTKNADIKNITLDGNGSSGNIQSIATYCGSFIGYADHTEVKNCFVKNFTLYADFSSGINDVGGFIGRADNNSVLTNCGFSGNITGFHGSNTYGGFIGSCYYGVEVYDCFAEGRVINDYNGSATGGFIGAVNYDKNIIQDCYSTCQTIGMNNVGGFLGNIGQYVDEVSVTGCRASGSVWGTGSVGGFIGYTSGKANFSQCLAEGEVTGTSSMVGGFVGIFEANAPTFSHCRSKGSVVGLRGTVGGFVGEGLGGMIIHCAAEGAVTGENNIGGFGGDLSSTVSNCYAYGDVSGVENVGGFSGRIDRKSSDCYAVGNVSGNNRVGGFAGSIFSYVPAFTNCFTAGTVFCDNPDGKKGAFFGENNPSATYVNCYFDRQMAGVVSPDLPGIEGLPTSELTKKSLQGFDGEDTWVFTAGYYPQLKVFAESDDAATRLRSALSVVPLQLANDETVDDVQTIIRLVEKTPAGDAITWFADPEENITVVNNLVYVFASDAWRTLTLRVGKAERTVQFRPAKSLIASGIDVYVNGKRFQNINTPYTYPVPCGGDESVVAVIVNGYAPSSPVTVVTLFANQPQRVVLTTDGGQPKTYTFTAEKPLPSTDIFVQRWDDVLAVNNNPATNGGYIFTEYEWYKIGNNQLLGTKGYILLSGPGEYTATLRGRDFVTQENVKRTTCTMKISNISTKMAVYPNPVQRGHTVHVETGIGGDAARHVSTSAVMQLFDVAGNIIAKQTLHDPVAEIAMPDTPGQYILQVMVNGVAQTFKIVVE